MHRLHDEKVDRLRALPGFDAASARRLRALAGAADLVEVEGGRVIHESGHQPRGGLLLLAGTVELVRDGRRVGSFGPGDLVGGEEILDGRPASIDAVTAGPVIALAFFTPQLRALFGDPARNARSA